MSGVDDDRESYRGVYQSEDDGDVRWSDVAEVVKEMTGKGAKIARSTCSVQALLGARRDFSVPGQARKVADEFQARVPVAGCTVYSQDSIHGLPISLKKKRPFNRASPMLQGVVSLFDHRALKLW